MKIRFLALAAAAALALPAQAQDTPAKPAAKPAAGPVVTVNGTAIPRARLEYLMRQQAERGADNEQARRGARRPINSETGEGGGGAGTAKKQRAAAAGNGAPGIMAENVSATTANQA